MFWKMLKAIPVIRLELISETDLILRNAISNSNGSEVLSIIDTGYTKTIYNRPEEERKRDAKNARMQFAHMNKLLKKKREESAKMKRGK